MINSTRVRPPIWFWIVSVLALLWNLLGVMAYLAQVNMTDEALAALPEAERTLYENQPMWATMAFAIAVWGGALGSLALLLRKRWARAVLLISLIGIIVQMTHSFFLSNNFEVYGPDKIIMPIMIIVVGVLLVLFARMAINRNWFS